MKKRILLIALVIMLLATGVVVAAPPDGEEHIVQSGDWLSKIAGEAYDDVFAYPIIVWTTNSKAAEDDSFDFITDADVIEVGQKLWIPTVDGTAEGPTLLQLMNNIYSGIYEERVQLTYGRYEGEPYVPGGASRPTVAFVDYALGHLNEDGIEDAAVILVENSGGSGSFYYLAAVVSQGAGTAGEFVNVATRYLGDRLRVKSLSVDGGDIRMETITHGPDDPMCCPTLEKTFVYSLQGDLLVETAVGEVTLGDLSNGTYAGIYDEPVQLVDGQYEGEPFVEGGSSRPTVAFVSHAFGDLNGDGATDAAVALVENSGGSGVFWYLAALTNEDGQLVNVATQLLGDRWQVREMSVVGSEIHLDVVTHGPDDPMCCPSLQMSLAYGLQGNRLVETSPGAAGIYKGFLPAATCCGRDVTLFLDIQHTARRSTDFLNGQPPIVENGLWQYGEGGAVVLSLTGQEGVFYEAADVITYALADRILTAVAYDTELYGSFGPAQLTRFEALAMGTKRPLYDEAAASKLIADSDFVGIYKGFLPAATCCGQDITLSLSWDNEAQLRTDYLNGEPAIVEVGTWKASAAPASGGESGLTVTLTGQEERPYDEAKVIDFVLDEATLITAEDEDAYGSVGLTLYVLQGIIAATFVP